MRFSASLRFIACFVPVTLVLAALAGGQTLEHRPEAELSAPTNAAPPSDDVAAAAPKQESKLPTGTGLQVEIARHYPMKAGQTIEGRLMHPILRRWPACRAGEHAAAWPRGRTGARQIDPMARTIARELYAVPHRQGAV